MQERGAVRQGLANGRAAQAVPVGAPERVVHERRVRRDYERRRAVQDRGVPRGQQQRRRNQAFALANRECARAVRAVLEKALY